MSLIQSGPVVSEMNQRASPVLSSESVPLIAVEPYVIGKMVGNSTNLNLSKGPLLVGKNCSSLGLSVLEKSGHSGKEPVGMSAGIMANRIPIVESWIE